MNANTKLTIGHTDYHGWFVEIEGLGVLANAFETREEALKFKIQYEIEENKKLMKKIDELLKK